MVLELAQIPVTPGSEQAFAEAFEEASGVITRAPGCRSARLTRGVEQPSSFVLLVEWDSVDAHERFRASDLFGRWRALVGPHFAAPPDVQHYADV